MVRGILSIIYMARLSRMPRTKSPDYTRLDDIDVYIQSTPISDEEEKRFSEVLKAYRVKHSVPKPLQKVLNTPKRSKASEITKTMPRAKLPD
jgi:hypothetical protein